MPYNARPTLKRPGTSADIISLGNFECRRQAEGRLVRRAEEKSRRAATLVGGLGFGCRLAPLAVTAPRDASRGLGSSQTGREKRRIIRQDFTTRLIPAELAAARKDLKWAKSSPHERDEKWATIRAAVAGSAASQDDCLREPAISPLRGSASSARGKLSDAKSAREKPKPGSWLRPRLGFRAGLRNRTSPDTRVRQRGRRARKSRQADPSEETCQPGRRGTALTSAARRVRRPEPRTDSCRALRCGTPPVGATGRLRDPARNRTPSWFTASSRL